MVDPIALTTLIGALGAASSVALVWMVERKPKGTPEMIAIWRAIRDGSNAYLRRQFRTIGAIAAIIAVLVVLAFAANPRLLGGPLYGLYIAGSFLLGVAFSLIAAYIAMDAATRANVRTAYAAHEGTHRALRVSIYGGGALGLAVISMSLLGLSVLYALFRDPGVLAGFGFGASLAALFAQLGGGIYTKSADIGADLVGKVEAGIPEDDPRNPAVIADNVGDNVGDEAGRGADLFESVTAENIGGMIIALVVSIILFQRINEAYVVTPLIIRALGVVATWFGILWAIGQARFRDPMEPLRNGVLVTTIVAAILMYIATQLIFGATGTPLFGAMIAGLIAGLLITLFTEMYTGAGSSYVRLIAHNSQSGPALTVTTGLATGMISTGLPILAVVAAIIASYMLGAQWATATGLDQFLGGIYGTTMATMGMLSTAGMILTLDGVGPIADNAGGIVEMSKAPPEIREKVEPLDALGNTTKALTKGYAMGSAALAALLLFQAFILEVARFKAGIIELAHLTAQEAARLLQQVQALGSGLLLNHPTIVIGIFVGAMLPFVFSGMAIGAVARGAHQMVAEVRRQFREIPGLLNGAARPDYATAVDIATRNALRLMVAPTLLVTLTPIIVGYVLGWQAIGAMVIGATVTAIPLAIMMMWGGGALDNAKKHVEAGNLGGKGSPVHAATVIGDTLGDPLKDTAGPSLHILIKLLNTLSLVFVPLFLAALIVL
jgi:K(+)-stimulated pyrophosphate-energized sodium pump